MHMFINGAMCICTFLRTCHRVSSKYLLSWRVKCKNFNPLTKRDHLQSGLIRYWGLNWASAFLEIQLSLNHTPPKAIMTTENQSFEIWRCISYETWRVCIVMFSGVGGNYLRQFALNSWPFKTCSGFPTKMQDIWCGTLGFWCLGRRRCIHDGEREREIFRMEPFCWHNDIEPTSEQKGKKRCQEREKDRTYGCVKL